MPVNSEGEDAQRAQEFARLTNDVAALTNLLTIMVKRYGAKTDSGKIEVQITTAELTALADGIEVSTEKPSNTVLVRVTPRSAADIARNLTDAQRLDNARAVEVALPKSGLITPPKGIIIP